jgi:hypothetical protein
MAEHIDNYSGQFNAGTCSRINSYVDLIRLSLCGLPDVNAFTLAGEVAGCLGYHEGVSRGQNH